MAHTKIINLRRTGIINSLSRHRLVIMLTLAYVIGIIIGVVFIRGNPSAFALAKDSFSSYCEDRGSLPFWNIALISFKDSLVLLFVIFLSGTSVIGVLLAPLAVFYNGVCYGAVTGYIYKQYLIQGIAFNSLIFIPCSLMLLIGVFLGAREAFVFSSRLFNLSLPKGQAANLYRDFKTYCLRYLIILLLFILAAVFDAGISVLFFKYFSF